MAAKKPVGWRREVAKRVGALQKSAGNGWEEALKRLPTAQRKTVKEFTANVEKARVTLRKRAERLFKEVGKRAEGAVKDVNKRTEKAAAQAQKRVEGAFAPLTKRAEGVLKDFEKRAEKASARVEKGLEGIVSPLTKRLDLASRRDIDKLRKRIDLLEKRLVAKPKVTHTAAPTEAPIQSAIA
jgi:hypothetical protein